MTKVDEWEPGKRDADTDSCLLFISIGKKKTQQKNKPWLNSSNGFKK